MAITVDFNGVPLITPGAYSKTTVALTGGFPLAPAGIVGIVGEAEGGAPGDASQITTTYFSPEQFSQVVATYKSGPIVDACQMLFNPSADARVPSGAQQVYIYKTNQSTQASAAMLSGSGTFGVVKSQNWGITENLINFQVEEAQAESLFSTTFNFIPDATNATTLKLRVNGGAVESAAALADATPATFAATLGGLTGVSTSGGAARGILAAPSAQTLALATTANVVTITYSTPWAVAPVVGDTLYIPLGSAIVGAGNANAGGYLVTAVGSDTVTAVKLGDPTVAAAVVAATAEVATTDVESYSPITLTVTATTPAGVGSSLELYDGGAALPFEDALYGGVNEGVVTQAMVTAAATLGVTVTGAVGVFTVSTAFGATPAPGDMLWVPPGSTIAHTYANVGAWRVSSASPTTITATKITGSPATVAPVALTAVSNLSAFDGVLSSTAAPIVNRSAAENEVLILLNRQSDNTEQDSAPLGGNVTMLIGYLGTTAALTITSTTLSTSISGGSGANLNIRLSDFTTLNDLATYIGAQTGYTCSVANALYGQLPPSVLDQVSAVGIAASVAGDAPGRIKKDAYEVTQFFASTSLALIVLSQFAGLPEATVTRVFLSGGATGGTPASEVSNGIDAMQKVRINSLVPLFSQDAISDILAGKTEPSSTYSIAAIQAAVATHVNLMSNTKNRSERNGYVSYEGTYAQAKVLSNTLADARVSFSIQDVLILGTDGNLDWQQAWGMSCIAAGMQAGAPIGEPMTFKSINVSGIRSPKGDFDPTVDSDDAIENGILFAQAPQAGGFRIVLGNTTYGQDANFVYNRISVLYAADTYAYNLRAALEDLFIGVSDAVADVNAITSAVIAFSDAALNAGLIVGDPSNDGTGFKNLIVNIVGDIVNIQITITPVQGIDFILPTITLDNVQS